MPTRFLLSTALVCALAAPALAANVQIPTGNRMLPLHSGISATDAGLGFHAGSAPNAGAIGGLTPAGFTGGAHARTPSGNVPLQIGVSKGGIQAMNPNAGATATGSEASAHAVGPNGNLVVVRGSGTP
jgi:hypothetical protein